MPQVNKGSVICDSQQNADTERLSIIRFSSALIEGCAAKLGSDEPHNELGEETR